MKANHEGTGLEGAKVVHDIIANCIEIFKVRWCTEYFLPHILSFPLHFSDLKRRIGPGGHYFEQACSDKSASYHG